MDKFVHALVCASEKSACIARAIRQEKELFELLVEEKKDDEKNKRFCQDFKTLADVLIQATVCHDVAKQFPEVAPNIKGEESNQFTNTLGEMVVVEVAATPEDTAVLLGKVLDGNMRAAHLLSREVHRDVKVEMNDTLENLNFEFETSNLGIWIDPIDSTAEYIHGPNQNNDEDAISSSGLHCVTVLIGVYDLITGLPVVGVVNQPFHRLEEASCMWHGRHFWGVAYDSVRVSSISSQIEGDSKAATNQTRQTPVIVMSSSESDKLKTALQSNWNLQFAAGAGYKQLCVALGLADAYILSKGTTFKWDCCAPHGVLRAMGGGVVSYSSVMTTKVKSVIDGGNIQQFELKYTLPENEHVAGVDQWCNSGGLIAFRDMTVLQAVMSALKPETKTAL